MSLRVDSRIKVDVDRKRIIAPLNSTLEAIFNAAFYGAGENAALSLMWHPKIAADFEEPTASFEIRDGWRIVVKWDPPPDSESTPAATPD